jgi:hypothetical protein
VTGMLPRQGVGMRGVEDAFGARVVSARGLSGCNVVCMRRSAMGRQLPSWLVGTRSGRTRLALTAAPQTADIDRAL